MGLFKRQKRQPASARNVHRAPTPAPPGDPTLPGSAGYRGTARLPKNAMPQSRFTYVRPDRKPDQ